jgi:hypothetical protein
MPAPTLFEKIENMQPEQFRRWLGWMFLGGALVLCLVFGAYAAFFSGHRFEVGSEAWGQFGDFIGGTANPLLGFLTLSALILTLVIQNRQLQVSATELRLSREELELTRRELERTARAQELSEQALRAQAETAVRSSDLTALNFLLISYRAELDSFKGMSFMSADPKAQRPGELRRRLAVLEATVDNLFDQVVTRQST